MNVRRLIARGLVHHWRTHLGVLLGVACATAVLVGALVVGDSVRASLRAQALQRVGAFESVLACGDRFVTAALADKIGVELGARAAAPQQQQQFARAGRTASTVAGQPGSACVLAKATC